MADKNVDNLITALQEINVLVGEWYETQLPKMGDLIEDLMIIAYLSGRETVAEELDYQPERQVNLDRLDKALNLKIDGKTFRDRIDGYLEDGGTPYDFIRIAETEFHRMYNTGGYDTAVDAGASTKTWNCMNLPTSRDSHRYLDGMTVGMDEAFYTYNGHSAMYPHDFNEPSEDINCLCWLTYNK